MPPPRLYDLTELQRHANRLYGFSAKRTLDLAQALYEKHKLISYPRTDSRYLSKDLAPEVAKRGGVVSFPVPTALTAVLQLTEGDQLYEAGEPPLKYQQDGQIQQRANRNTGVAQREFPTKLSKAVGAGTGCIHKDIIFPKLLPSTDFGNLY